MGLVGVPVPVAEQGGGSQSCELGAEEVAAPAGVDQGKEFWDGAVGGGQRPGSQDRRGHLHAGCAGQLRYREAEAAWALRGSSSTELSYVRVRGGELGQRGERVVDACGRSGPLRCALVRRRR